MLVADPDVKLLKELDIAEFVNCFVEESPSRFDSTVFTEDDILEDCGKLETDASSEEETTEEVTASDTVDDVPSVLLSDKVTIEIPEDGTVDKRSEDNETDEEIVDNSWEDTADACTTDDKITEELDKTDSDIDDDDDKDEEIVASDELLTTEELADVGAGVII